MPVRTLIREIARVKVLLPKPPAQVPELGPKVPLQNQQKRLRLMIKLLRMQRLPTLPKMAT
jgi:hypothetical protein